MRWMNSGITGSSHGQQAPPSPFHNLATKNSECIKTSEPSLAVWSAGRVRNVSVWETEETQDRPHVKAGVDSKGNANGLLQTMSQAPDSHLGRRLGHSFKTVLQGLWTHELSLLLRMPQTSQTCATLKLIWSRNHQFCLGPRLLSPRSALQQYRPRLPIG